MTLEDYKKWLEDALKGAEELQDFWEKDAQYDNAHHYTVKCTILRACLKKVKEVKE